MNNPSELVVVALIILFAGGYLTLRYIRQKTRKADGASACGKGSCGCSAPKPKAIQR